jgi:hypothetical protein
MGFKLQQGRIAAKTYAIAQRTAKPENKKGRG